MTWVLHWKATLAMTAAYASIAVPVLIFIKDGLTVNTILLIAFFIILLAGNMFVRRR
jgi:hypothetical protein